MTTTVLGAVADRFFGADLSSDVPQWAMDTLGEHFWSGQREIAESVRDNRYTAVKACHDSGKSYGASRIGGHWLDQHTIGEAFLVSTAPTATQVEAILWREIEKMHRKGKLTGRITGGNVPSWKVGGELIGYGRKPADYDQAAFQGIHARFVLIVIDEADGVPKSLFDAVDALATNVNARVLAIGNPDNPTSHFASVCKPGSGWNVITIDGLRTPNFRREDVEPYPVLKQYMVENGIPFTEEVVPDQLRDLLLSPQWVDERMKRWGVYREVTKEGEIIWKVSALWQSKVRGQFPTEGDEGVIPLGWVEDAVRRWMDWDAAGQPGVPGRRVYGVDVASTGEDETSLATRQGHCVMDVYSIGKQDTMTTAARVKAKLEHPQSYAVVDVIGVGTGVVDWLRKEEQAVIAFNASKSAKDRRDVTGEFTFNNMRSYAWYNLRELLDPRNASKVMLPPDEGLLADLTAPKWRVAPGAVIVVESKDDIRKRLGRSPDKGDAVIQAFVYDGGSVNSLDDSYTVAMGDGDQQWSTEYDYSEAGWGDVA
jgi:hypothetical protein